MTDGFGYWLAGLIDGEGSFNLYRKPAGNYLASMVVMLRDDDKEALLFCHRRTRIGSVYTSPSKRAIRWSVRKATDTRALVMVLDRFPLQTKKGFDYLLWREAIIGWPVKGKSKSFDWSHIAELKRLMEEGRKYKDPGVI